MQKDGYYAWNLLGSFLRYHLKRLQYRYVSHQPEYLARALSVQGQISPSECQLLSNLASTIKSGCIVEIGSYRGRSTIALAWGSKLGHNVPVYAIEPHLPFRGALGGVFGPQDRVQFFKNVLFAGVPEVVNLVNLKSEDAAKGWNQRISLLWIDGDHTYKAVKRDFTSWEPFVVNGGLIAFHDSVNPELGPYKLLKEIISSGGLDQIEIVNLTTVLRKIQLT